MDTYEFLGCQLVSHRYMNGTMNSELRTLNYELEHYIVLTLPMLMLVWILKLYRLLMFCLSSVPFCVRMLGRTHTVMLVTQKFFAPPKKKVKRHSVIIVETQIFVRNRKIYTFRQICRHKFLDSNLESS